MFANLTERYTAGGVPPSGVNPWASLGLWSEHYQLPETRP